MLEYIQGIFETERRIFMQNYNNTPRNPDNPHNAVEVPIPNEKTSFGGILVFIFVLFGLILAAIAVVKNPYFAEKYGKFVGFAFIALFFFEPVIGIISPFIEMAKLKRVCTEKVTGTLVSYAAIYIRGTQNRDGYDKYAPKYEIYINGRLEIRTLNDFTTSKNSPKTMELLANPKGYEIIPANGKMSYSGKESVKAGITLCIIIGLIFAAIAFFSPF